MQNDHLDELPYACTSDYGEFDYMYGLGCCPHDVGRLTHIAYLVSCLANYSILIVLFSAAPWLFMLFLSSVLLVISGSVTLFLLIAGAAIVVSYLLSGDETTVAAFEKLGLCVEDPPIDELNDFAKWRRVQDFRKSYMTVAIMLTCGIFLLLIRFFA